MKKLVFCFLFLGFIFILTGCNGNNLSKKDSLKRAEETKQIVWGVRNDVGLFGLMNIKTGKAEGFDIDIANALTKEILGKSGKAVFIEAAPKTRIPLLKNGNIDAIIATMTITSERSQQVDFSDVYFDAGQTLLVKKGSRVHSVSDLNERTKVIAAKGSTGTENIRKVAPQAQVLEFENYSECFTALKSGQGEAMTADDAILMGIASQNPGYVLTGGKFTTEPYGIAANRGQTAFVERINQALQKIHQNGEYDQIYNKWFGKVAQK
ncbi:MAG: glutamate ABC transporter substrate-binding protein [Streptococcaceae bacterium]|jgi:putative glutamine transport system substrate-binding protein|nr:glutamate ABC transporter substrate-binding protein [Streptococcaceae bacterium]